MLDYGVPGGAPADEGVGGDQGTGRRKAGDRGKVLEIEELEALGFGAGGSRSDQTDMVSP